MKTLFIHDHDVTEIPDGGAQQTTAELIRRCPYDIDLALPATIDGFDLEAFDLLIVSNCKFFSRPQLERILAHRCFIKHERDYYNLVHDDHVDIRKAMFEKARAAVFLSPGHAMQFQAEHPDIDWSGVNLAVSPPPVDPAKFNPWGSRRRPVYAFTAALHQHKGVDNFVNMARLNPGMKFEAYGRGPLRPQLEEVDNIEYKGTIPFEDMPDLFNEVAGFVHLPNWLEPYGRAAAEARLCGCEVVVNDRVGAATFPWFWDYPVLMVKMLKAAGDFWKNAGGLV
jgi:glycosyltransferase involved in cell wall biosynthesis